MFELFKPKIGSLVCPRCERELDGHDEEKCRRKMSRRFFLGAATGIVVAAAITSVIPATVAPPPTAWFPGAQHMLCHKGDHILTRMLPLWEPVRLKKEVEDLSRLGFGVMVSDKYSTLLIEHQRLSDEIVARGYRPGDERYL